MQSSDEVAVFGLTNVTTMASPCTTPPAKRKRSPYSQKYSEKWEDDVKFKGWLSKSSKGSLFYHCKVCNYDGKAGKSEIERHAATVKHVNNVKRLENTRSVLDMPSVSGYSKTEKLVKEGEIRLAAVVSELNLPFTAVDRLLPVIKAMCPDSVVAKKFKCGKTKCSAIVKNVLGRKEQDDLLDLLRNSCFSLIANESTDRGCIKHLALVARVAAVNGVKDMFLTLVPLESATASSLYEHIKSVFRDADIPYKENMIGFAADGANVMMGVNNSLSTLLKQDIPNLFVMKCICHSFHLCASYACKKLPRWVEDLARDTHNYFLSPKQSMALKEFQEFVNVKPHKILHPSQTRWLSLHSVVKRLLEQLPALKLFFTQAVMEDRLEAAQLILQKLNDPVSKLYLEFLDHVLPFFTDLNKEMQAEDPKIYVLSSRVSAVLATILDCYLKPSYLKSTVITKVKIRDPANFLPLQEIYLGGRVTASLQSCHNIMKQDLDNFRLRCLDFYIESASQILQRFNLSDPLLESLKALDPQCILMKTISSIAPLASKFPNIVPEADLNTTDNEWRLLRNTELNVQSDISVWEFWKEVKSLKKGDGTPLFPLVGNFMTKLLCLPHSSASVERVFSQINLLKTKTRNSLNTDSLIGMIHAKRTFENSASDTFNITNAHMTLMTDRIYRSADQQE